MEYYKITFFGKLDDLDAFDEILFDLQDEAEPEDRARRFEAALKDNDGEVWFERSAKNGSPFYNLKPHLVAANLGWKEMIGDENRNYYQVEISTPEDRDITTVDLVHGEPVVDLPSLLQAKEDGLEALTALVETFERNSLYGQDLPLILADGLVKRYIDTIEPEPSP